jgi:hypothetical protein
MIKNIKEKIFELKIDENDELSGIDSISLVDEPAIEVNWMYFKKEQEHEFHIPDNEDDLYISKLIEKAQDEQELLDDGWVVDKVILKGQDNFYSTKPNAPSVEDETEYKVRYKYILKPGIAQRPIISTTRDFCKTLINKNFVWRIEDMESTTNDFGDSALVWRGGFNCRHVWARIEYRKNADIINKGSVTKGRIETGGVDTRVLGYTQPSTVTSATLANPSPSTVRNLGLSKQFGYDNNLPSYVDQVSGDTISKSLLGSVIICEDCGWEWEIKDGGEDPYICHKCGCDNSPKTNMSKQFFTIDSEEKRTIIGPAMIANQNIFRKDEKGNPYYVFFSADTIRMIADKYMKNQYTRNNDLMHNGKAVKDVYVVESWIKEDMEDKSNKYGYQNLPIGSWFVSMKCAKTPQGDKVWEQVKNGELNGFSVSGFFSEEAKFIKEEMFLYKLAELLNKY